MSEFQIRDGNLIASFDLENEDGDIDFCKLFKVSKGVANEIGMFVDYVATNKIIKDQTKKISDLEAKLAEKDKEIEDYAESLSVSMCKTSELALEITKRKEHIIEFIEELAWHDVQYDAFQSTMGDMNGCRSAIPRYAKKYFDLWKEMFKEDLKIEKGEE